MKCTRKDLPGPGYTSTAQWLFVSLNSTHSADAVDLKRTRDTFAKLYRCEFASDLPFAFIAQRWGRTL